VPTDGSPGNLTGIVDLEIDQLDVHPDYGLNAVAIEIVSPKGDGACAYGSTWARRSIWCSGSSRAACGCAG
jgi:hypothetical protein